MAKTSALLDTNVIAEEKLYGYHRLQDPLVIMSNGKGFMTSMKKSEAIEMQEQEQEQKSVLIDRNDSHLEPKIGEPKKW